MWSFIFFCFLKSSFFALIYLFLYFLYYIIIRIVRKHNQHLYAVFFQLINLGTIKTKYTFCSFSNHSKQLFLKKNMDTKSLGTFKSELN